VFAEATTVVEVSDLAPQQVRKGAAQQKLNNNSHADSEEPKSQK